MREPEEWEELQDDLKRHQAYMKKLIRRSKQHKRDINELQFALEELREDLTNE